MLNFLPLPLSENLARQAGDRGKLPLARLRRTVAETVAEAAAGCVARGVARGVADMPLINWPTVG